MMNLSVSINVGSNWIYDWEIDPSPVRTALFRERRVVAVCVNRLCSIVISLENLAENFAKNIEWRHQNYVHVLLK